MSIETKHFVVCDRCKKTINQMKETGPAVEVNDPNPLVGCRYRLDGEVDGFDFYDLCEKCEGRVSNLLAMMEMRQEEEADEPTASESHPVNGTPQSDQVL